MNIYAIIHTLHRAMVLKWPAGKLPPGPITGIREENIIP